MMPRGLPRWIAGAGFALVASLALPAFAQAPLSEGEVRKVDKDGRKITLRHGEIKNLDMPPMTMVFGVKNPAMLDAVKSGDKVQFRAVSEDGKYVVTEILPAR